MLADWRAMLLNAAPQSQGGVKHRMATGTGGMLTCMIMRSREQLPALGEMHMLSICSCTLPPGGYAGAAASRSQHQAATGKLATHDQQQGVQVEGNVDAEPAGLAAGQGLQGSTTRGEDHLSVIHSCFKLCQVRLRLATAPDMGLGFGRSTPVKPEFRQAAKFNTKPGAAC
jgi:hypothetical protein